MGREGVTEETFGALYCDDNGPPGGGTRLMVSLHYLL